MHARCIHIANVAPGESGGSTRRTVRRSSLCQVEDKCLLLANRLSMLDRKTLFAVTSTNPFEREDMHEAKVSSRKYDLGLNDLLTCLTS